MTPATRRGNVGLSLLALLVVTVIVLVIIFMPGGQAETALEARDTAQEFSIDIQAQQLATAVTAYRLTNDNRNPESQADLSSELSGLTLTDPWDEPLRFTIDGRTLTVTSAGPDNEWNTDDDIAAQRQLSL